MRALSLSALLLVCLNGCFINGNGQLQGEARDNGNGNASNNGNGNASNNGNGNASNNGNADPKSADGHWDILSATGGPIGRSEMVVASKSVNGFIAMTGEGSSDPRFPWCTRSVDRREFSLAADGDAMTGTFSVLREWTGSSCPSAERRSVPVSGARTAAGTEDIDGAWDIHWVDKTPIDASVRVSLSGGTLVLSSAQADLSFAARRR